MDTILVATLATLQMASGFERSAISDFPAPAAFGSIALADGPGAPLRPSFAQGASRWAIRTGLTPALPGPRPTVTLRHCGADIQSAFGAGGAVTLRASLDRDPVQPSRCRTLTVEDVHSDYLTWHDLLGSGLDVGLDSRTRLDVGSLAPGFVAATGGGLRPSLRHDQHLHLGRQFDVFATAGPDLALAIGYRAGVGLGTAAIATPTALTHVATASVRAQPLPEVTLSADVEVPLQAGSGGRGPAPAGRLAASIGGLSVGTTQGALISRYDASWTLTTGRRWRVGATGALDRHRITGAYLPSANLTATYDFD